MKQVNLMHSALLFHLKLTLKNTLKSTIKKPLKTIGMVVAVAYFTMIPFMFKDTAILLQIDNAYGFVIVSTILTLYFSMPITLSYFKRNGINFKKPDVNFMFATPIPPKQVLFYGLIKQVYLQIIIQVIIIIAGIYVFNIPFIVALGYGLFSLVVSSLLEYSLAMIMYGSERLTKKMKSFIKWFTYLILLIITILLIYKVILEGFSLEVVDSLFSSPILILTPIFGWKLGFLNLVFLGPTTYNVIASTLYFISAVVLFYCAYKMKSTGDYYEDAIKFTERQAIILEKQASGNFSFNDMLGKKKKIHRVKGTLKGLGATSIFYKQWLEKRRTSRFLLGFKDLILLIISVGAGIIFYEAPLESNMFFATVCGVGIYISIFFSPNQRWKEEFNQFYIYILPLSNWKKIWYATLIENLNNLIQACLLTLPVGLILKASPLEIILAILVQVSLKIMITYKSIFFEGYIESKLGKMVSQFASIFLTIVLIIYPVVVIVLSFATGTLASALMIITYSVVLTTIFMFICTKALNNIDTIKGN